MVYRMAFKTDVNKCPSCGAVLKIDNTKKNMFCPYCGSSIKLINEGEHVVRHINDAEIKQVEADYYIRMKQIELQEKELQSKQIRTIVTIIAISLLVIVNILSLAVFNSTESDTAGGIMLVSFFILVCIFKIKFFKNSK